MNRKYPTQYAIRIYSTQDGRSPIQLKSSDRIESVTEDAFPVPFLPVYTTINLLTPLLTLSLLLTHKHRTTPSLTSIH